MSEQKPDQWQKRHPVRTMGKWENTHEHDAKWWRDNSSGWEIRALYAAPQAQPARLSDGDIARHWFATTEEDEIWPSAVKFAHAIAAAVIPPGFVVVPEEPTEAMCKAGDDCQDSDPSMDDSPSYYTWRAMIAAAKGVNDGTLHGVRR